MLRTIASLGTTFFNALLDIVGSMFYLIWRAFMFVIDLIEGMFKKFAGLDNTVGISGVPKAEGKTNNVVETIIINNPTIANIFTNLVIFSIVLLIFFTILQIIREQYKDKNGGNPYIIVFRLVKAAVLFIFIPAACVVGLQFGGVVLKALDRATGGGAKG